jgi:flagellar basal-body rod protein FlgB
LAVWENCSEFAGFADETDMLGISGQADLLVQLLRGSEVRHQVISQNLANVNTAGYKRLTVKFEDQLAQRIESGDVLSASSVDPEITTDLELPERADGNNVDIDMEIGELQRNALLYQTYTQVLASQFGSMRRAISGE